MDELDATLLLDMPSTPLLTTKEVAYLLGITEGTLRWMRDHPRPHPHHPPFVKVKGRYFYPTPAVVEWIPHYLRRHPHSHDHLRRVLHHSQPHPQG